MSSKDEPIRRWDPLVNPASSKWTNQLSVFRLLLDPSSTETLDSILSEYFTPPERELAIPATSPLYLVELQADRTARYRRLLASRFRGVEDDTATRLTMLYFGLPSEPVMSGMFRALDADVEMLDGADVRTYEVRPPLHFLTAYDHRHYGRDELRGTEAPLSYIPVTRAHATALKLGCDIEKPQDPAPRSSLRGGGEADDIDLSSYIDDTTLPPPKAPGFQIMCGFQGSIGFYAYLDGDSIEGTIRRLLSIAAHEKDAGHRIVITHLDVGRLNSGDGDPVIKSWADDYPLNVDSFIKMVSHSKTADDHSECCRWFVRFEHEDPPDRWIPSEEDRKQMVTLALEDAPNDLAYFPLPRSIADTFTETAGKSAYSAYMRTAMQVLLGRMSQPGDNHRSVSVLHDDLVSDKQAKWCYGGLDLPPQVYERLHGSVGRATPWKVRASRLDKERIALCLPGYEQIPDKTEVDMNFRVLPENTKDAWTALYVMLDEWLPNDAKAKPVEVALEPTYDLFEGPGEDSLGQYTFGFDKAACNGFETPPYWAGGLADYLDRGFQKGHRAFTIFVGFSEEYKLIPAWVKNIAPEDYDSLAATFYPDHVKNIRRAVKNLLDDHPHPVVSRGLNPEHPIDYARLYITLESVPPTEFGSPAKVVITPETTMVDFARAMSQLMSSKFLVSVSYEENGVDFAKAVRETAIPWGPRYGDIAVFECNRTVENDGSSSDDGSCIDERTETNAAAKPKKPSPAAGSEHPPQPVGPERNSPGPLQKPSIFDKDTGPSIPTDGPPKEQLLRTGGPGVPMVSRRIQTPTEQQRALEALHRIRNSGLGRAKTCNYMGCSFAVRADDAEGMQRHLEAEHLASRCPWCSTELFEHMSQTDKEKHIAHEHGDRIRDIAEQYPGQVYGPNRRAREKGHANLSEEDRELMNMAKRRLDVGRPPPKLDIMRVPRAPDKASAHERAYNFCDRCGRDHREFSEGERDRHDKICVPRAPHGHDVSWCEACGAKVWRTRELSRQQEGDHVEWPHSCDSNGGVLTHKSFCSKCGYPLGNTEDRRDRHAEKCKGFSGKVAQFCPYCGVSIGYIRDHNLRRKHMVTCAAEDKQEDRPEETPYVMYPSTMWEEPGPRPEDDQFYTGWREDLHPRTWAPNGGDPDRTIPPETAADLARAQKEARERAVARAREEAVLIESDGGSTQGASSAATESEEDDIEEVATTVPSKKRPAKGGKEPERKRQKTAAGQTEEEPAPPSTEIPQSEEAAAAHATEAPQTEEESAAPATETSQPESVSRPPAQQPHQSPEEPGPFGSAPEESSGRHAPRVRKRVPSSAPGGTTHSLPRVEPAERKTGGTARQPAPPAQGPTDGDEDPNFTPGDNMWCSRCFRKKPTGNVNLRSNDPSYEEQMEAHMDPNGSCRIRRARGKLSAEPITVYQGIGIGLPNQSGWMHDDDLPKNVTAGKVKEAFKEQYPNYGKTIYPVGSKTTQSVWKHDPNNSKLRERSIEISRALPMPPDKNATAVLAEEAQGSEPKKKNGGSPNKTGRKKVKDETWRDNGDRHSEDSEPDSDQVGNDDPEGGPLKRRKRKRKAAAAPTTPANGGNASGNEDGENGDGQPKQKKTRTQIKLVSARGEGDQRHGQDMAAV